MNESIFKKIWNYSITVGQMVMTALAMAIVQRHRCCDLYRKGREVIVCLVS